MINQLKITIRMNLFKIIIMKVNHFTYQNLQSDNNYKNTLQCQYI